MAVNNVFMSDDRKTKSIIDSKSKETGKPIHIDCDHDHDHSHGHHHHHHHGASDLGLAFFLNLIFAVIEIVGGIYTNSVAIISDAIHDLGDSIAIGSAWYLEKKSKKSADSYFSYGYRRLSTLSAVITGVVLFVGSILVFVKSIPRLLNPEQPEVNGMIFLAVLGVAVNGYAALKVSRNQSLNSKMISLHLLEDVLGWVIVLVAAIVMKFFDFPQIDPILAILLSLWVLSNVVKGLKSSFEIFLQKIPAQISLKFIEEKILEIDGVKSIHHLHSWSLDGDQHILTAHVIVDQKNLQDWAIVKSKIKEILSRDFKILEATLELEYENEKCIDPEHSSN